MSSERPSHHRAVDVPLAEVAAEDPAVSIEHESEATTGPVDLGAADNDTPPEEPTLTSLQGLGPVSDGDDLTI